MMMLFDTIKRQYACCEWCGNPGAKHPCWKCDCAERARETDRIIDLVLQQGDEL